MVRQRLVQSVADEPADRQIDLRLSHQPPIMDDAEQEARQHQTYGDFGIDTGPAIVGTIKLGQISLQATHIER